MVGISFFLSMMQDYGTDQVTVQRLQAVPGFRGVVKAAVFNACTDFIIVAVLLFIGLGIFAYSQSFPGFLPPDTRPDQVLPYYVLHRLPDGVSGMVITAIFAAAMSSLDSGINSLATVIDTDLVQPNRKVATSEALDIRLARRLTLVLGALATGVAFYVSSIGETSSRPLPPFSAVLAPRSLPSFSLACLRAGDVSEDGWLARPWASG